MTIVVLDGIAEDIANLVLHAAAVLGGAPLQALLHIVIKLANNQSGYDNSP